MNSDGLSGLNYPCSSAFLAPICFLEHFGGFWKEGQNWHVDLRARTSPEVKKATITNLLAGWDDCGLLVSKMLLKYMFMWQEVTRIDLEEVQLNEAGAFRVWYHHCRKWMFWVQNLHPARSINGNIDSTLQRHLPHYCLFQSVRCVMSTTYHFHFHFDLVNASGFQLLPTWYIFQGRCT